MQTLQVTMKIAIDYVKSRKSSEKGRVDILVIHLAHNYAKTCIMRFSDEVDMHLTGVEAQDDGVQVDTVEDEEWDQDPRDTSIAGVAEQLTDIMGEVPEEEIIPAGRR